MIDLPDGADVLTDLLRARHLLDRAVGLLARAGDRCLASNRPGRAADLLARAYRLLETDDVPAQDAETAAVLLESLLTALFRAGRPADALRLGGQVDDLACAGLPGTVVARLRLALARSAVDAGLHAEAAAQLTTAREVLGTQPDDDGIAVDALAARLTPHDGADLAARTLEAALRQGFPDAACQALDVLGSLAPAREQATWHHQRMAELAGRHRLDHWALVAQLRLGTGDWLAEGITARLDQVVRAAARQGAAAVRCSATAVLALDLVLRGHHAEAERAAGRCRTDAEALGLGETLDALDLVGAVLAAHQGRQVRPHPAAENGSPLSPFTFRLVEAFGALLAEDRSRCPGGSGLRSLVDAVAGRPGAPDLPWARWDRQFALFARAVVLGRNQRAAEAMAAFTEAEEAAAPFPVARQLALRLVAEAAHRDGWGQPVDWLREAETFFHTAGVTAVAGAARALLRRWGVPVPRRRDGAAEIPAAVRRRGVTVREYEVLRLVISHPGNRTIAQLLHISPRTVEKHVANLLMKLGLPNRDALNHRAEALLAVGPDAHGDRP
ncbi:LuxR C-terminal-related transcriptional regulator [Lentzea sp. NPDC059081]|uniref:LuxR C-terminal-related transcriptional regulator n=1 Tax=Lentzea sp. NPDC059081 TaxID=3346719 RepID=UPI0036A937AC